MREYSMLIQVADITIRFESELESDICSLNRIFKYHIIDIAREPDCTVVLERRASFVLPKDAELLWRSQFHGVVVPPEKMLERRRLRVFSKSDTFGVASCYVSRGRNEYYYGLMRDKSWLTYNPSEHRINYVLHKPILRKNKEGLALVDDLSVSMPLLLHVIATVNGCYLTHGAAVSIDGKASLFLGRSGSGKSTLSTDLARQKASFMGDDLVLIYLKNGVPMVGSILFHAKLFVDSAEEKRQVDVPTEMQTSSCLSAPLRAIYSVQQSGLHESTVEPRPSVELLQRLMDASNGMVMQFDKNQWLADMYEISEGVPYSIFHFGDRSALDISILKN